MKLLVKKNHGVLVPLYNSDYELLKEAKLKEGETYEIEIKKKRNAGFHKKYFSLLNLCFDNQEHFELFDDMRDYLTVKSGFYRKVIMPNGFEQIKPKSISFANMDDIEFQQLYNKTINVICELLNTDSQSLLEEIVNYI